MAARSLDQAKNDDSIPENRAWEEFLPACKAWWRSVRGDDGELIFYGSDWSFVEAALHELAHVALLKASFPPTQMIEFISKAITDLPLQQQLDHEAGAWVIEILACQELGIPLEMGDAIAAAEVQGVHEADMEAAFAHPEFYADELRTVLGYLQLWKTKNEQG